MPRRRVTNETLFAALRAWVADNYPGMIADRVELRMLGPGTTEKVRLPIPRQSGPADDGPIGPFTRAGDAILQTLQAVGHRLTTTPLLREMAQRGYEFSERTIAGELARLVEMGTLDNRRDTRPAGYGLPEWEQPAAEPEPG